LENAANRAIEKAKQYKKGQMNLTWGSFVTDQIVAEKPVVKKASIKKVAAKKTETKTKSTKK
jgi:hypothetical protein